MKSRILSQLDECQGFPTPHFQSSGFRDLRDSFVGRAVNHFTTQPSAIYECIFKKCIAIGQLKEDETPIQYHQQKLFKQSLRGSCARC